MQMIKVYHTRPERRTWRSLYFLNGASNCLATAQSLQNAPCVTIFSHHLHNYRNNPFFTKLNCAKEIPSMKTICQTIQHQQRMVWNIRFGLSQCNWNCTLPRTKSGTSVDWSLSSASRARIRLPRKPSLAPFTSSGLEISRWKWQSFVWALYCKTYIQVVAFCSYTSYVIYYI